MQRDTGLPWLFLVVLGALAVSAAILGLNQAPSSADLAARNAVGETLLAPSFTAVQTSTASPIVVRVSYSAPDTLRVLETYQNQHRATTVTGQGVQAQLATLARLEHDSFTKHGSVYVTEESAQSPTGAKAVELVLLTVDSGKMVRVDQHVTVTSSGSTQNSSALLRFLKIGDWTVPAG
jgi:hypothetical protein